MTLSRRSILGHALGTSCGVALTSLVPSAARALRAVVAPPAPTMEPARTWVLSIGVLSFARRDLFDSFPAAGRQDDVLCDALLARGVPAAQLTRLRDTQATRAAILAQIEAAIRRVPAGHDLLLYYCGHGVQGEDGTTYFTATDSGDDLATGYVSHGAVLDLLDAHFHGRHAILFADCCYSGALPMLLAQRAARRPYAALASSLASEISTGHWTFTESLIAAFSGEPRVDTGHEGRITLADLAGFAEEEMAFAEGQLAPFRSGSVPTTLVLGTARPLPFARYGERVLARWSDGRFYPAHVTGQDPAGLRIRYVGEDVSAEVVQPESSVRAYSVEEHAVGTRVEVRWRRRWFPATVLEARLGVHRVHYDDFAAAWDEWVSRARIRALSPALASGAGAGRRGRRQR